MQNFTNETMRIQTKIYKCSCVYMYAQLISELGKIFHSGFVLTAKAIEGKTNKSGYILKN